MEGTKHTLVIGVEALSRDCFEYLLDKVRDSLKDEIYIGKMAMEDGDHVEWEVTTEKVKF